MILNIIPKINFFISDLNLYCSFNILNGLKLKNANEKINSYVSLSSDSLNFIFKNEFGFDTLLVNARFSLKNIELKKVIRGLGVYSFNASGRYIGFSILGQLKYSFFKELFKKIFYKSIR